MPRGRPRKEQPAFVVPNDDSGITGTPGPTDYAEFGPASGGLGDGGDSGDRGSSARDAAPDRANGDAPYGYFPDGRPRKRAPNGTRASGKAHKASPVSVSAIEKCLFSLHAIAAAVLDTPELGLAEDEAKVLAKGVADVAVYYPNTVMSDKAIAHANLAMIAAAVYGTRLVALGQRKKMERAERMRRAAPDVSPSPFGNVVNMPMQPG